MTHHQNKAPADNWGLDAKSLGSDLWLRFGSAVSLYTPLMAMIPRTQGQKQAKNRGDCGLNADVQGITAKALFSFGFPPTTRTRGGVFGCLNARENADFLSALTRTRKPLQKRPLKPLHNPDGTPTKPLKPLDKKPLRPLKPRAFISKIESSRYGVMQTNYKGVACGGYNAISLKNWLYPATMTRFFNAPNNGGFGVSVHPNCETSTGVLVSGNAPAHQLRESTPTLTGGFQSQNTGGRNHA